MRSRLTAAAAAFAVLAFAAPPSGADDVQDQLRAMQERMQQVEDRLQATTDELQTSKQQVAEQQQLIERSGIANGSGASSGLASFLDSLEIGGWVTASYWYNVNDPDNDDLDDSDNPGVNQGAFGHANFFQPDNNTFSIDQLWFELRRPTDESNRAGFGADILFGKHAGLLSPQDFESRAVREQCEDPEFGCRAGDATDLYVHQAYAEYLAPIGNGVRIQAGKFMTLLGYETIHAPYNNHITRGIVWQNLQPIDHTGVLASTSRGGWEAALGLVNSFSPIDPDQNDGKSVMGRVGFSGENFSVLLNGIWGPESPDNEHDKLAVGDVIITLNPNDRLSLFANGDFLWADPDPVLGPSRGDQHAWGAAVGGRLALTDRTGFSVRGEYLRDDGAFITGSTVAGRPIDATLWSATGTVDHKLTDKLILRGEVRWDRGRLDEVADNLFVDDTGSSFTFEDEDQLLVGVDLTYLFN